MVVDESIVTLLGLNPRDGVPMGGGAELAFNCPFCTKRGEPGPDTKRRLEIHVAIDSKFGFAWCFRCGFKTRLGQKGKGCSFFNVPRTSREEAKKPKEAKLPKSFAPLLKGMNAYEYLAKRGISDSDIAYYDLGYAWGRVIFPDYDDTGKLVYWVGRSYDGREPKYKNSPVTRSDKIYNLGRFKQTGLDSMTVVEGPISAISAGRDTVATYGKGFSPSQIEIIRNLGLKRLYIALDADARKDALTLAEAVCSRIPEVYLVPLPVGCDPNVLGRKKFREIRNNSLLYNTNDTGMKVRFLLGAADAEGSQDAGRRIFEEANRTAAVS